MDARSSVLLFRTSLAGIFLGAVATIYFFAGLAGFVTNPLLNALVAASLALALIFFLCSFVSFWSTTNWVGRLIWLAILLIILLETLLGLTPPTARDEVTHHLAIPKLYVHASRIIEVPFAPYAYFPMLLDMLYTPWIAWGRDWVPKLVHALYGYLTGFLIYAYLTRRLNSIYGLVGFFFFVSTPVVLRLNHWAYVDLGVTFYTISALLCLLRWAEDQDQSRWLALAALSTGFAMATKPNGYLIAALLGLLYILLLGSERVRAKQKIVAGIFLFGPLTFLPLLPWLAKNWVQTGNPFYPLLSRYFQTHGPWATGAAESFIEFGVLAKRALVYGETDWQIALLPLRLFFFGRDDNPQYFDGALSPLLILLLPWAFRGKWLEEKKWLFGFAVCLLGFAVFLVDMRARYVLAIVPPLVILTVYGVFNIYGSIKKPLYLYLPLIAFAVWNASYLFNYLRAVAPWDYVTGRESRVSFLTRTVSEYPVYEYLNRQLPQQAKVYLIFVGRRAYYCDRDYFHDPGELPGFLLHAVRTAQNSEEIVQSLRRTGITDMMIQSDLLSRYLTDNLTPAQALVWDDFVARELHLRYANRGYALYQIAR